MKPLSIDETKEYVDEHIVDFHRERLKLLAGLNLRDLLTTNPYLFPAKNVRMNAGEIVVSSLNAFLSSSEEKLFGDFLEGLAVFVAQKTCDGHKSAAQGVDLEFINNGIHYVVSIKSGPNWGNSSQQNKLEQDLKTAVMRIKQSHRGVNVQPVLGICYGNTKTTHLRGYMKIVGQNFWYLISENEHLYTDIIEPIGYRAKEHNEAFSVERDKLINRFTKAFINEFCIASGAIDWVKLVEFNSRNFDLDRLIP